MTGATGHIGNCLVRELVARGRKVRCLVLPSDSLRPLEGLAVEVVRGDVRDREVVDRACRGAEFVYHLASVIALSRGRPGLLDEVNVGGTRNVVEACRQAGVRRLVYTSSVHALVEPPRGTVIDESLPFDPERIPFEYGRSKARATLEVLAAARAGLDAVVVCPTGVIGPYDFGPSEMGQFFLAFARRQMPAYVDGGYDFVDVRDVAAGHIAAAERGRSGEVYLLSGEQITVRELMVLLGALTGAPVPRLRAPAWLADAVAPLAVLYGRLTRSRAIFTPDSLSYLRSNSATSSAKARRELGFSPRPVRESVAEAVEWFQAAGVVGEADPALHGPRG
ncbi:MAG: SDR family oxidoreductase [Bacillota bacterium]